MLTYAIEGQHVPIMTLKQSKVKVISLVLPDIFCLILLLINYTLIIFDINLNPFILLNTPPNHVYPGYIAFTPFSLLTSYNVIYHFYVSLLGGGGSKKKEMLHTIPYLTYDTYSLHLTSPLTLLMPTLLHHNCLSPCYLYNPNVSIGPKILRISLTPPHPPPI